MKTLKQNLGFSLAEIIMTILITLTIWIIWVTYSHNYKLSQYNTKRIADIDTLQNTINSYYEVNKTYPEPNWNKQYYDNNGTYSHSRDLSYWVSWFVTANTFPKQFMNYLPLDPQSNNFYAYAKTNWDKLNYQFATVLNNKWSYSAYIKWDFPWEDLAWIIKEYSWPNFLIHWSEQYLPYNPYELKLIWNIVFYSWSIKINDSTIIREIVEWDILKVSTWWIVNMYLSDWSELTIWDNNKETQLVFTDLKYKNNDNIVTKVLLTLNLWEIWVKAPKLEQDSEFKLETDNAAASLRWTVFWMNNEWNGGWSIKLIEWKIEVEEKIDQKNIPYTTSVNSIFSWSWFVVENKKTYMEVKLWEDPILLNYSDTNTDIPINTWSLDEIITENIKKPLLSLNSSYIPNITLYEQTSTWLLNLIIENKWANFVQIIWDSKTVNFPISSSSWVIQLSNIEWFWTWTIKIQLYSSWSWFVNQVQSATKEVNIALGTNAALQMKTPSSIKLTPQSSSDWVSETSWSDEQINWDINSTNSNATQEITSWTNNTWTSLNPTLNINSFAISTNNIIQNRCNKWASLFAHFWCQNDNLLAYADYNWDIFLYDKNWNTFPSTSSWVISLGKIILEKNLENVTLNELKLDIKLWNKIIGNKINEVQSRIKNLSNKIIKRNFQSNNTYLKYDLSSLNLKDKFIIEIWIKWINLLNNANNIYFKFWKNEISFNNENNFLFKKLNKNEIYKIKLIVNWTNNKIQIIHPDWYELLSKNYDLSWNWDLYIWNENKWNNTITYVKIFSI